VAARAELALGTFEAPSILGEDQHRLPDTTQGLDGYSDWSAHGPASESQAARPTPGVHSPSPALRRSWIARAARACSAALRPARRSRQAGWTPGTAAHRNVLDAGFLEGPGRTRAEPGQQMARGVAAEPKRMVGWSIRLSSSQLLV
jgi:hypothetical protein